jgi:plasmid stability protein
MPWRSAYARALSSSYLRGQALGAISGRPYGRPHWATTTASRAKRNTGSTRSASPESGGVFSNRPACLESYHSGVGLTRQQPHFQPPFRCQPELDRLRKAAKDGQATQAECRDWLLEAKPLEEGRTRLNLAPRGGVKLSGAEPLAKYFFSGSIERISSEKDQVTFEGTV